MDYKKIAKRDRLLGKFFDGAECLNAYFLRIIENSDYDPYKLASDLGDVYDLTANQRKYFKCVAVKVAERKDKIRNIEEKYGLDFMGNIKEPKKAFRELHKVGIMEYLLSKLTRSYLHVDEIVSSRSFNIAIGFELCEGDRPFAGKSRGIDFYYDPSCYNITNTRKVIQHELRHTINKFLKYDASLEEATAYLYCGYGLEGFANHEDFIDNIIEKKSLFQ